jgi:hypothetical protein
VPPPLAEAVLVALLEGAEGAAQEDDEDEGFHDVGEDELPGLLGPDGRPLRS